MHPDKVVSGGSSKRRPTGWRENLMSSLRPGQLVESVAGRDKGREMVVLKVLDDGSVFVADGDLRRVERPKKKNVKHVKPRRTILEEISRQLMAGARVTNAQVREAIARAKAQTAGGG